MTDAIPQALQYKASQSNARVNTFRCRTTGSDTAGPNGSFSVKLPERSLVNVASVKAFFDLTITGLVSDATNWANANIPASYKLFRNVKWNVGGITAANGLCQHQDLVHHALLRASVDDRYCLARLNQGYKELVGGSADDIGNLLANPGATSKTQHLEFSDILGMKSRNYVIDTSLFGTIQLDFQLNDICCLTRATGGSGSAANITFNITNFRVECQAITNISPYYIELLSSRLSASQPIRLPFQNIVSTVVSAGPSTRLSVNSACVDALLTVPLNGTYTAPPALTSAAANNARYAFNTATDLANADLVRYSIQVGSEQYPKSEVQNALELASHTAYALYGNSVNVKNMLFAGAGSPDAMTYSRANYMSNNAVVITDFSLGEEAWSTGILSGLDTASSAVDVILNQSNYSNYASGNILIAALCTSQLVYDTGSASVQVVA